MAMVFKFRMLSDENDNFLRDYEVLYDMSLLEFHNYICETLDYDAAAGASFFLADKQWEKLEEFTYFDVDGGEEGPRAMDKVTLGRIIRKSNDRLIYTFDMFGDRSLYLELTATLEQGKDIEYPRITLAEAAAPDQFDASVVMAEASIFEEALGDFNSFEGDDYYDDEF